MYGLWDTVDNKFIICDDAQAWSTERVCKNKYNHYARKEWQDNRMLFGKPVFSAQDRVVIKPVVVICEDDLWEEHL